MISYTNVYHTIVMNIKYPRLIKFCLFCKSSENSFESEEHIFPESLGNKNIVLPPGIVCDKCNGYFGSKLENDFISTNPAFFYRCFLPITTKKGHPPKMMLPEKGRIYREEAKSSLELPTVYIQNTGISEEALKIWNRSHHSDAPEYKLPPVRLPDEDIQKSSRVLAKIALELLCLYSYRLAFAPEFDFIRNFARYAPNARQGEYIPYAWKLSIGQPFRHYLFETKTGLETSWSWYALFTLPGIQYLYPLSQTFFTPAFSELAEEMHLKLEADSKRSKPVYLMVNLKVPYRNIIGLG